MAPEIIHHLNRKMYELLGAAIRKGALIIYPTETAYGLGCSILNEDALRRVYEVKRRPQGKNLLCVVADVEMALQYCILSSKERILVRRLMPGPLTILARKRKKVPELFNSKFGFRISSNRIARNLVEYAGVPIVSTSANLTGESAPYSIDEINPEIIRKVDFVIDAGRLKGLRPSTIMEIDLTKRVKIIREGPIGKADIERALRGD